MKGEIKMNNEFYDVIVVGGGAAGVNAAISAAHNKAKTLLLEKNSYLGGISTGVIDTMYGFYTPGKNPRRIVGGLPYKIVEKLEEANACFIRPNTYGAGNGITYNQEILKYIYDTLIQEAGVEVLLHSEVCSLVQKNNRIKQLTVESRFGKKNFFGKMIVDATGDGDIAYLANVPCEIVGRDVKGQSLTTTFKLANIDTNRYSKISHEKLVAMIKEANATGEYNLPREDGSIHFTPMIGVVFLNMTRIININPTELSELTKAEFEGRKQVIEYYRFLKDKVPGFEKAGLVWTSSGVGVRESRRIIGKYVLNEDDVIKGRKHFDDIVECGAPIEDHIAGSGTDWVFLEEGQTYGIPYRTLLPKNVDNLIVAGRCFSATHIAHASARSIAQIMSLGAAAGTAAAIAAQKNIKPEDVEYKELKDKLI